MCSTANLSPHSPSLVLTRSIQQTFPTLLLHSRSRILPTVALARLTRRFNRHSPTPRFRPTHFFLKCSPRAKPAGINSLYVYQYCGETSERILFLIRTPRLLFLFFSRFPRCCSYLERVANGAALAFGSCLRLLSSHSLIEQSAASYFPIVVKPSVSANFRLCTLT